MLVRSVPGGSVTTDGVPEGKFVTTAGGHLTPSPAATLGGGRLVVPDRRQGGALGLAPVTRGGRLEIST